MTQPHPSFSQLIPDMKSDLFKSFVMGVLATVVAATLSVASEIMPAEFKQPVIIAAFGTIIALLSLGLIWIKRHSSDVKIIFVLVLLMIIVTIISVFAFFNYTYKGLFFATRDPILIVFYPEQVSSEALQTSIESSVRGTPGRLKGGENYYQVKKIALPEKFDFEHSLLKRHIDQLASVISYVQLIPESDKIFVKTGFPAGLPYLKMGLEAVKNTSLDEDSPSHRKFMEERKLEVKLDGYFEYFIVNLTASEKYSTVHYGLKNGLNIGTGIGARKNKVSSSDLLTSSLSPVNGGQTVESSALSGSIYFSLVSGLIDYYRLIGEDKMSCAILFEDYLSFDQIENSKKNLNFFPKTNFFECLKNISLKDKKPLFDLLSVKQRDELQKDQLRMLMEGQKTQEYLINIGLYDDSEALDIANQIGKTCRKATGFDISISNMFRYYDFASCLQTLLQKNNNIINKHSLLKTSGVDVVKDLYGVGIINSSPDMLFNYVEKLPELYRTLEQENKSCDLDWDLLVLKYAINAGSQEEDIKFMLDTLISNMEKVYQLSKCEKMTSKFGFDIRRLLLDQAGRDMLKKLVDDIATDWKNDTVLYTLLSHIQTNLLGITSYLELYEVEGVIKELFNIILRNPEKWLAQEFEYLKQRFNFPDEISDVKLPSDFSKKIATLFQDIDINSKPSDLRSAEKKMKTLNLIDKDLFHNVGKVFESYFLDAFTRQFFAMFKSVGESRRAVIERKTEIIHNRTLDKMILFYNLENPNVNPKQLLQTLQIIKDEHNQVDTVITNAQLKHYEFYVSFKNKDTLKAVTALDSLIALNESPYADFYRFAKSVLESRNTVSVCRNDASTAEKILAHLLSPDFISGYWNLQTGEDAFNKTIVRYLALFAMNEKEEHPELVTAFQNCEWVAQIIERNKLKSAINGVRLN